MPNASTSTSINANINININVITNMIISSSSINSCIIILVVWCYVLY